MCIVCVQGRTVAWEGIGGELVVLEWLPVGSGLKVLVTAIVSGLIRGRAKVWLFIADEKDGHMILGPDICQGDSCYWSGNKRKSVVQRNHCVVLTEEPSKAHKSKERLVDL